MVTGPFLERAGGMGCSVPELLAWSPDEESSALGYLTRGQKQAHSQFKIHFCIGSKTSRLVTPGGF